jgi:hypothetical protein
MGQVLQALLMFLAGWSLCQYRHSLRSEYRFEQWKSQEKEWMSQLNHHSDLVVEKETELAQARLRLSELEMALDLARSKAMVNQKAMEWDLQ